MPVVMAARPVVAAAVPAHTAAGITHMAGEEPEHQAGTVGNHTLHSPKKKICAGGGRVRSYVALTSCRCKHACLRVGNKHLARAPVRVTVRPRWRSIDSSATSAKLSMPTNIQRTKRGGSSAAASPAMANLVREALNVNGA